MARIRFGQSNLDRPAGPHEDAPAALSPLPRQALEILIELRAIIGRGRFAFPSARTVLRPISENPMNAALRRLGYATDKASPHGFRATASTLLNESGLWHAERRPRGTAKCDTRMVYCIYR
jgi:integrase